MEFINEDSKPRFLLKSRHSSSSSSSSSHPPETLTNFSKTHFSCCYSAATAFLLAAFSLSSYSSITFSLLIWFSLSLFLAPFAPQSLTFGDPRVGRGDPLPLPPPNPADLNEPRKRSAVRWNPKPNQETLIKKSDLRSEENKDPAEEWTLEDLEILKRQVLKYPAGELGRWERVSEAFEGRHGAESVIRAAKSLAEKEGDWTLEDLEILKKQVLKHPAGEVGRWERVSEAFKGRHGVESVIRAAKSLLEKDSIVVKEEEDWTLEDLEILKKQVLKHPAGAPGRWERVSEAFKGRHGVESVIRAAKTLLEKDSIVVKEEDWTLEDLEILKKQISKHPAGAPGRWERVSEIFKGRHGVESVIRAAKSLSGKGPPGDDSFAQFLKQRKPLDKRADGAEGDAIVAGNGGWSSGEDIALLNALKAFPKDVEMRWEKVAAAVPGKSKADCVKRVAELKRDFRSSKNSES